MHVGGGSGRTDANESEEESPSKHHRPDTAYGESIGSTTGSY
jgi:hypothetical protein